MKDFIRTVSNYPIDGVDFYDLNSLFADQQLFKRTVDHMTITLTNKTNGSYPTHIVGLESRGFVIGAAVAHAMNLPFVMIRKKGSKYPGKLLEESYGTEYSTDTIVLQEGLLGHTSRVILVDDLVATGGSIMAAKRLVEQTGASVLGAGTIIDLKYLHNEDFDINVAALDTIYSAGKPTEVKNINTPFIDEIAKMKAEGRTPEDFDGIHND